MASRKKTEKSKRHIRRQSPSKKDKSDRELKIRAIFIGSVCLIGLLVIVLMSTDKILQNYGLDWWIAAPILVIYAAGFIYALYIDYIRVRDRKGAPWLTMTLALLPLVIVFGTIAIDSTLTDYAFDLNLTDSSCKGSVLGKVICSGTARGGVIYEGTQVNCKISIDDPKYYTYLNLSAVISSRDDQNEYLASQSSSNSTKNGKDINFTILEGTTRIEITLTNTEYVNTTGNITLQQTNYCGKRYRTFMTLDEVKDIRKEFLSQFFTMLSVVCLSLPFTMLNLKKLSESKSKGD